MRSVFVMVLVWTAVGSALAQTASVVDRYPQLQNPDPLAAFRDAGLPPSGDGNAVKLVRGYDLSGAVTRYRQLGVDDGQTGLVGRVLDAAANTPCGISFSAGQVTYQILVGPPNLIGRLLVAQVPCMEMPLIEGDVAKFEVGATHALIVTDQAPASMGKTSGDIIVYSAMLTGASRVD